MSPLMRIEEPAGPPARRFALLDLGFRPFYLLASGFAALSIGLWALQFAGWLPHAYLEGPLWHAHEMLFGFALAVIVGFLFTAGRNWTNQPTPTGAWLAALALLWVAARVLVLTPWGVAAAVANVAFPWAAAVALAIPLVRARNRRNYFFVGVLALLGVAALLVHLARLDVLALPAELSMTGIRLALDLVLFVVAVMAGRVVPMFSNNGVPGLKARREPFVERAALGSLIALGLADVAGLGGHPLGLLAMLAALAHAARWWLWQPWGTLRKPLVWVLHLAYAWIPVHLALRAAAAWGLAPSTAATHALATGAVGGMIIGMMTRTARGHTARLLKADGVDVACYALVALAALVRVVVPIVAPGMLREAVVASAVLWSAGFGLYALRYGPFLVRPRLDGKPG